VIEAGRAANFIHHRDQAVRSDHERSAAADRAIQMDRQRFRGGVVAAGTGTADRAWPSRPSSC
jgi:hypothetical protein